MQEHVDWIIKRGCNLIGQKIDYLNTNNLRNKKLLKSCTQKRCKQEKEKCRWPEVYRFFLFYILIITCLFL